MALLKVEQEGCSNMSCEIKPSSGEQPASFKDSVIMNLKRNKMIMQHKIQLIDQAIAIAEEDDNNLKFAQVMGELQEQG
jgi:hypothetical protein